ncbi:MAG: alpha-amylase [Cyclobacteriaceae bacterium]|nr:alpha-amylase [Cyclobacteriaceae bacterium]
MVKIAPFLLCIIVFGCARQAEKIPPVPPMKNKPTKMVVYQMMTRLFGNKTALNKPYGTLAENGVGKFNDINGVALRSIKDLGVTHVWYTGVIEHAVLTDYSKYGIALDDADVVKGRAGSPYAIKDYYDVNPDLAVNVPDRMKEFEQLVERTHSNGLKVLIDFVPNHIARAYKSDAKPAGVKDLGETDDKTVKFSANNNFYYLPGESFVVPKDFKSIPADTLYPAADGKFNETPAKVTGNNQFTASPGVNEWFETVKLNYGVDIQNNNKAYFEPIPDTWIKMKDILVFWANKKVDGFRCDMAEMVPVEFWNWAIPQVKAVNPEIVFVAEIYNPAQYRNYIETGKFDYLYDKVQLYDTLRGLINNKRSAKDIDVIQKSLDGINANMLHFLENHDEQRIASPDFAGSAWKIVPAMVVSATIDQGPVMIYFGQEVGEPGAGAEGFGGKDGRTTIFDYWGVPEHQKWMNGGAFDGALLSEQQKSLRKFYSTLLNLSQTNPAIVSGGYFDLTVSDDVHAFVRHAGSEKLLIVSNFDSKVKPVKLVIPENVVAALQLKADKNYKLRDVLWKNSDQVLTGLTLSMNLPAYSAYVFTIEE